MTQTHSTSSSSLPVARCPLRRAWGFCPATLFALVTFLTLAACSANDADSRTGAPATIPENSGAPGPTEAGERDDADADASPSVSSEGSSLVDCNSAVPPTGDLEAFIANCRAQAAGERGKTVTKRSLSTATAAVYDSRTTVDGLDFTSVPTWSDAEILSEFAVARDTRYMTQTFPPEPSFQRRVSWLFPDDGCFARAEQFDVLVAQSGKTRPHKLFAFGFLRVFTNNAPGGMVSWWYHVVPVVKDSSGAPIVFDPAVSPCKPLPYRDWLALMVDDMADYDDVAGGYGVALGDSWSYAPFSLSSGEPSHSEESLDTLQGKFLYSEWSRQTELDRDPNLVLGAAPPWSGDGCL